MTATQGRPTSRARRLAIAIPVALAVLVAAVLAARGLRTLEPVESFVQTYSGPSPQPDAAPTGIPGWVGWQHFLNMFLMVLIIRTGWLIRTTERPRAHWTAKKASPLWGSPPRRISMDTWLHVGLDLLWLLNGLVFAVLIAVSGQWMRIVPTSWEIVPHAASAALQYLSLSVPAHNGWAAYNGLQVLAYFTTVFIAAPLAVITGVRISPAWRPRWRLGAALPLEKARGLHLLVMLYFVVFIIVHVTMVMTTGALANLNTMYAARDEVSWMGLGIFAVSVVVTVIGWVLARPLFTSPIASLTGRVTR